MYGLRDMSTHRVLVSGFGSIGRRHLKNLHALGVTELAFSDPQPDSEGIAQLQRETGAEAFTGFEEALKAFQPDIVFICSPTKFHIPQALAAARAGAHLFIEKPLSHTREDIDELKREVDKRSIITMVSCNWRFHPGPRTVKKLIDDGIIGDVLSANIHSCSFLPRWRRKVPYKESYSADPAQGGVLLDCIHEIDLALWYFGAASLEHAYVLPATSIDLTVDGFAELLLRHESGVVSNVRLSFIQKTWRRGCEIVGSKGTIEWDLRSPPGLSKEEDAKACIRLYGENGQLQESFPTCADHDQPYLEEAKHFLAAVAEGVQTCTPLADGKAAVKIALAARAQEF